MRLTIAVLTCLCLVTLGCGKDATPPAVVDRVASSGDPCAGELFECNGRKLTAEESRLAWERQKERMRREDATGKVVPGPTPAPPKIGMSTSEAQRTAWGAPQKRTVTDTPYGVREQWVFAQGQLSFIDDVLTSIQVQQ